jgi:hypothetical protein
MHTGVALYVCRIPLSRSMIPGGRFTVKANERALVLLSAVASTRETPLSLPLIGPILADAPAT